MKNTLSFAKEQDAQDPLKHFRDEFIFPQKEGEDALYFCGNSLGLLSRTAKEYVHFHLEKWGKQGVEGHFEGEDSWYDLHKKYKKALGNLVGAEENEVVPMNNLTTNLHLLMASFYRPKGERFQILTEAGSFPSDRYALESQVQWHGYEADKAIIELNPDQGSALISEDHIIESIKNHASKLAMVLLPGIQYYSGQFFDLNKIAKACQEYQIPFGVDLAHAIGNVPLKLHDWQVDFAVWCSYKYLNSGPGAVGGAFVHSRHFDKNLPRLAGWWGYDEKKRFNMESGFIPTDGVDGWQLSNANVLGMAAHWGSLQLFEAAGMPALREKSLKLTAYLEFILQQLNENHSFFKLLSPKDPEKRGCQLSLAFDPSFGKRLFEHLSASGVICDWREPDVIRLAPTPLYNSFKDVYRLGQIIKAFIEKA